MNFTINGEGLEFGCVISNVVCKGLRYATYTIRRHRRITITRLWTPGVKIKRGIERGDI